MTCPGCEREGVALIGGFCGHCSDEIAAAVNDALKDVDAFDGEVYDVGMWKDDYLHVRLIGTPEPPPTQMYVIAVNENAGTLHREDEAAKCTQPPADPDFRTDLVTATCAMTTDWSLCGYCEWPDGAQAVVDTDCMMGHEWCPGPEAEDPDPGTAFGGKCGECKITEEKRR